MKRHNLVQRINVEHNAMEDLGYAVETLELTKSILVQSLNARHLQIQDILPQFTEAAARKKQEWLESARSLLDSRQFVYLSSFQREVSLSEELKQEQLRHYEERIDESVATQRRLLTRIKQESDAWELLEVLTVNFAEKLIQYQAILDKKSQNIDLLERSDEQEELDRRPGSRSRSRPPKPKSFYLGGDDDEEEADGGSTASQENHDSVGSVPLSLGSLDTLPEDGADHEEGGPRNDPSGKETGERAAERELEDRVQDGEAGEQDGDEEEEEEEIEEDDDVYRSFGTPSHSREGSTSYEQTLSFQPFDNPRHTLDFERSLSPGHYGQFKDQLKAFAAMQSATPSHPPGYLTKGPHRAGHDGASGLGSTDEDLVRLYWACERSLPSFAYQVLYFTKPELRRNLANAPSTAESYCGPLHAACRQGSSLIVKVLLTFGADPTLVSSEGLSPLHYASESGNLELISILLATAKGDSSKLAQLLEGAMAGKSGYTPLTIAALKGDVPLAKQLLTRAENLPPHLRKRVIQRLLKIPCKLESQGLRGTPLEIATLYGHREMVLFLLTQGADPLVKEVDFVIAHPPTLPCVTIDLAAR